MINSPYLSLPGRIRGIGRAVNYLGFKAVREISLAVGINEMVQCEIGIRPARIYWRHCVIVAELARSLTRILRLGHPEEAHAAGLLHDLGMMFGSPDLTPLGVVDERADGAELDRLLGGRSHEALGANVARVWGLSEEVSVAIKMHHEQGPQLVEHPTALCVHLAEYLENQWGLSGGEVLDPVALNPYSEEELEFVLGAENLGELRAQLESRLLWAEKVLNV